MLRTMDNIEWNNKLGYQELHELTQTSIISLEAIGWPYMIVVDTGLGTFFKRFFVLMQIFSP